jgi:GR25 family glycosyltransferase involved in LPS biosynthesis
MNLEKTYCINLHHRTERWISVQPEFARLGIVPDRFEATKMHQGYIGCMMSHLAVLERAKKDNCGCFMVAEDDIRVVGDDPQGVLQKAMAQLPSDWDMLYLGANPQEPIKRYSENLFMLKNGWTTHAMVFNNSDKKNSVVDFILQNQQSVWEHERIDVYYADVIQQMFKVFVVNPLVASQSNAYSDITRKHNFYFDLIKDSYEKFTSEK